jgi:hypothetical protein
MVEGAGPGAKPRRGKWSWVGSRGEAPSRPGSRGEAPVGAAGCCNKVYPGIKLLKMEPAIQYCIGDLIKEYGDDTVSDDDVYGSKEK